MAPAQLFQSFMQAVADDGTTIILLLVIAITGVRRWWVLGREMEALKAQRTDERVEHIEEVRDIKSDRDQWRSACLWTLAHPAFQGQRPPGMPPLPTGDD